MRCFHSLRSPLFHAMAGLLLLLASASAWSFDIGGDIDFYPFPTYHNTRNEGNTYGGVLVFLVVNKKHEIEHVIAPLIQYNGFSGWEGGLLAFGYPSDHQEYKAVLSWSQDVNREVRLGYSDRKWCDGKYDVGLKAEYGQSGTERFFGLGPDSEETDESSFGQEEYRADAHFGLNLTDHVTVGVGERFRDERIFQGLVGTVPFVRDRFPGEPGVDGATVLGSRIYLTFDTRDSSQTPTEGYYVGVSAEGVAGVAGDAPDTYEKYEVEGKKFIPFGNDHQFVLVLRSKLELGSGPQAPFWDEASLGGEKTLRAFGSDRFIDRHSWLINVEQRIRIWSFSMFDYPLELEAAPFVDVGSVFSSGSDIGENVQVNPGVAVRLLSRPNIVGGTSASWGQDGFLIVGGFSFPF